MWMLLRKFSVLMDINCTGCRISEKVSFVYNLKMRIGKHLLCN